jgi:hypothetical protein
MLLETSKELVATLDRPVSFFMGDKSLFSDMVQSHRQYVAQLVEYDESSGDSILAKAMIAAEPAQLKDAFALILENSTLAASVLDLACASGGDSLLNHIGGNEPLNTFEDCNAVKEQLVLSLEALGGDPLGIDAFATSIVEAGAHHPAQFANFLRYMAYSSDIYSTDGYSGSQSQYIAELTEVLASKGNRANLGEFFDGYGDSEAMIDSIADDERLMHIVYNHDLANLLLGFDSTFGHESIDSAIAEVPTIEPPFPYAMRLSYATGIDITADPGPVTAWVDTVMTSHNFDLAEHDFYGSARLGVKNYWPRQKGLTWDYAANFYDTATYRARQPWYSCEYQDVIKDTARNLYGNTHTTKFTTQHLTGQKQYELTDHLGDVLATVSDARQPNDTVSGHTISWYKPVVKTAYDYYPFGMYMPGRYVEDTASHCTTVSATTLIPSTTSTWVPWTVSLGGVIELGGGSIADAGNDGVVLTTGAYGDGLTLHLSVEPGIPFAFDMSVVSASTDYTMFLIEGETVLGAKKIVAGGGGIYGLEATPDLSDVTVVVLPSDGLGYGGGIGTEA